MSIKRVAKEITETLADGKGKTLTAVLDAISMAFEAGKEAAEADAVESVSDGECCGCCDCGGDEGFTQEDLDAEYERGYNEGASFVLSRLYACFDLDCELGEAAEHAARSLNHHLNSEDGNGKVKGHVITTIAEIRAKLDRLAEGDPELTNLFKTEQDRMAFVAHYEQVIANLAAAVESASGERETWKRVPFTTSWLMSVMGVDEEMREEPQANGERAEAE